MALRGIIGQEKAVRILQGCISRGRIPHALLFAGDEGIGKMLTAINFAKALNCRNSVAGQDSGDAPALLLSPEPLHQQPADASPPDSCDTCPSCKKTDSGNHPDVFIAGPEGDGGQIKVEPIREIEEKMAYRPFEGNYKIAIIDHAEMMNQSAANAFLDTLEAPPAQSVIILISSRTDMILPTIRSRCQRVNFSPLPVHIISGLLKDKYGRATGEQLLVASMLSGGRIGYALDEDLIEQRDDSFSIFKHMLGSTDDETAGDIENLLDWALVWLRDLAVFRATGRADLLVNQDLGNDIMSIAERTELRDILKLARELYNIRTSLHFNPNEKLTRAYTGFLVRKRIGKIHAGRQ